LVLACLAELCQGDHTKLDAEHMLLHDHTIVCLPADCCQWDGLGLEIGLV
jgi:hypothetical protein